MFSDNMHRSERYFIPLKMAFEQSVLASGKAFPPRRNRDDFPIATGLASAQIKIGSVSGDIHITVQIGSDSLLAGHVTNPGRDQTARIPSGQRSTHIVIPGSPAGGRSLVRRGSYNMATCAINKAPRIWFVTDKPQNPHNAAQMAATARSLFQGVARLARRCQVDFCAATARANVLAALLLWFPDNSQGQGKVTRNAIACVSR